ncbi:head-tail connector protein [Sphingomonas xinjiangensis]|uniref:Putative phiE125 gp8 family phage protein n=1 Tax=Sphingomonas xinjiangensis TaxID=643568 RepID=A0A840YRC7_9SPHN|nr:hypothetical protein [Sphingomonas xinjiangensis]MBB5711453.1 putative phiE125 gp8 family phage protein [Sphingomonas xinjiangensis]
MDAPPFPAAALAAARDAAKAHLRILGDAEDAALSGHVAAAMALCEAFTGASLIVRGWQELLPADRAWRRLEVTPVTAIEAVRTPDGAALPADRFAIDLDAVGQGWVRVTAPGDARLVQVGFRAGLAEGWDALPAPITQGVVLLAAHLFEARAIGGAPPAAVAALWRPWRRVRL